jgi:hypothetical protein
MAVLPYQQDSAIWLNGDNGHCAGVENHVAFVFSAIWRLDRVRHGGHVVALAHHLSIKQSLGQI